MSVYEKARLKSLEFDRKLFCKYRKKLLTTTEFSIISNNCWAGMVYETFDLQKQSPTIGSFFWADDYVKFVSNLEYYIYHASLEYINPCESRHFQQLRNTSRFGEYPIGLLDDVEIYFLHYHDKNEAKEKWLRRCERINWNHLIIKFNDQNGCSEKNVIDYSHIPYKNKLFFTIYDWPIEKWDGYYKFRQIEKKKYITTSHEPYFTSKHFNLVNYFNTI